MKKSLLLGLVVMAERRVGLFGIVAAITLLSQITIPSKVWAGCISSVAGCVPDGRPGDCDSLLLNCVPTKPPGSIPPCECKFIFSALACSSGDAVLINKQFPVLGKLTYDISSPTRILQSIKLMNSSNIGSFTLPAISGDGHSATGGVFIKANSALLATFELGAIFITPTFACTIDPITTTLRIGSGHIDVQSLNMIPRAEHFIEIHNGSPGLRWLRIVVNGRYYRSLSLQSGTTNIDAAAAMNREENTLTFTGQGETGSFADINVSDSGPNTAASPGGNKKATNAQETEKQERLMFRF